MSSSSEHRDRRGVLAIELQAARGDVREALQFLVGFLKQVRGIARYIARPSWPGRADW